MLHKTRGIVLRAIKYGETSLICSIFTEVFGVQSYIVQGVRSGKKGQNRAGLLQPACILDLVVYHNPQQNLQRIKEFQAGHIYNSVQEEVAKNCIAMFAAETLLRLLPEHGPIPELFEESYVFFKSLDSMKGSKTGNYPIFFLVTCCRVLGYTISGGYSAETPYLSLQEGGYSDKLPVEQSVVTDNDSKMLDEVLEISRIEQLGEIEMNSATRFRLLDWLLAFMHNHTSHMGEIRSLQVLRSVLHA